MKIAHPGCIALAFVLAGAGSLAPDEALVYAPEEGAVLTRTFVATGEFALDDLAMAMDGEPIDFEGEVPEMTITTKERIVVTDELESMGDGRPLRLSRSFDELSGEAVFASPEQEEDGVLTRVSYLEDCTVVITWNEDDEEYTFEPAEDEEIDEELLDHLVEDMDFRKFLPEDEVAEGDSWEVPAEAWLCMMWPGGLVGLHPDDGELEEADVESDLQTIESLEGKGEATFEGVREEDDLRLAVITFELELEMGSETEVEPEMDMITSQVRGQSQTEEIEGELLWDLERGHLHSLTATAEVELTLLSRVVVEFEDQSLEQESRQVFTGEGGYSVKLERE